MWNDLFFIYTSLEFNYGLGVGEGVAIGPFGVIAGVGVTVAVGAGVLVDGMDGVAVPTPETVKMRSTTSPNEPS